MEVGMRNSWSVSGYKHAELDRQPKTSSWDTMVGSRGCESVHDPAPGSLFIRYCFLGRSCLEMGRGTMMLPWTRSSMGPISNCSVSSVCSPLHARDVICRPNHGISRFAKNARESTELSLYRAVHNLVIWSFNQMSGAVRSSCLTLYQVRARPDTRKPYCCSMLPIIVGRCSTKHGQTVIRKHRSSLQRFARFVNMGKFERRAVSFLSRKHSDSNRKVRQHGGR